MDGLCRFSEPSETVVVGLVAAMDPSGLVVVGLAAPRPWDSYSWVSCQLKWGYLGVIRVILLVSLMGLRPVPRRSTHRAGFIFISLVGLCWLPASFVALRVAIDVPPARVRVLVTRPRQA